MSRQFMLGKFSGDQANIDFCGYPKDLNKSAIDKHQYLSRGCYNEVIGSVAKTFDADSAPGMSGGPVFIRNRDPQNRKTSPKKIRAIHVAGFEKNDKHPLSFNMGCIFKDHIFDEINKEL